MYTYATDIDVRHRALEQTRGCYQRNPVHGGEAWSGGTLRGRANQYGLRYAASRNNLLGRLHEAGIPMMLATVAHGRIVLLLGASVLTPELARQIADGADDDAETLADLLYLARHPDRWCSAHEQMAWTAGAVELEARFAASRAARAARLATPWAP
jgi:hypothetical protein